jgi:hypothetical protein
MCPSAGVAVSCSAVAVAKVRCSAGASDETVRGGLLAQPPPKQGFLQSSSADVVVSCSTVAVAVVS